MRNEARLAGKRADARSANCPNDRRGSSVRLDDEKKARVARLVLGDSIFPLSCPFLRARTLSELCIVTLVSACVYSSWKAALRAIHGFVGMSLLDFSSLGLRFVRSSDSLGELSSSRILRSCTNKAAEFLRPCTLRTIRCDHFPCPVSYNLRSRVLRI